MKPESQFNKERREWLAVAMEVNHGKYRKETESFKESICIGLRCFAYDPTFRVALRLPPLTEEQLSDPARSGDLRKLILGIGFIQHGL
jgi:hypothetical protein